MTSSHRTALSSLCEGHPQRVRRLFAALDLERPALEEVQAAAGAGDWIRACEALLGYYRTCSSGGWLRHALVPPGEGVVAEAERPAEAVFPAPGGQGVLQIPRLPSGRLNWAYVPPEEGGLAWSCAVSRHDYMAELLAAFYATGNRRYVRTLNEHLYDWTSSVEYPEPPDLDEIVCPWGTILEVGHRAKAWPAVFYGLQAEEEFAPDTRVLLLSQALDHATFLYTQYAGGSNWVITEMTGLLSLACAWPEFREAAAWRELALTLGQQ